MNNENPSPSDSASYYVGMRDINFGVKNSTVKTDVSLVHLFETSAVENVAFWVENSTVQTAVFKPERGPDGSPLVNRTVGEFEMSVTWGAR